MNVTLVGVYRAWIMIATSATVVEDLTPSYCHCYFHSLYESHLPYNRDRRRHTLPTLSAHDHLPHVPPSLSPTSWRARECATHIHSRTMEAVGNRCVI